MESREIAELMRELGRLNMQVAELRHKLDHHTHGRSDPASDEHDRRLREIARSRDATHRASGEAGPGGV
jgi:hypothetical protein